MAEITGDDLIRWGFKPGRWFQRALLKATVMREHGADDDAIFAELQKDMPVETLLRTNALPYGIFLDAENDLERTNAEAVARHMDALMRVPTIKAGAVMPDACPSGTQEGTIPVGGVVACEDAIHPGFHSADICCSMAVSVFRRKDDPKVLLDAVEAVTHFGPGGREDPVELPSILEGWIADNPFLNGLQFFARRDFASQGDGNHFAYVGHLASTREICLVTHHGSRGLGAQLYKRGMAVAKKHTAIHAPKVPPHNAWIKARSDDGLAYWRALQIVRHWTRESHYAIHDMAARRIGNAIVERFWNEHNFVFRKDDGLYYHGKGATPSWAGFSPDDRGLTAIPLNMAEPILLTAHCNMTLALGFAPHGAGRNMGRKAFLRENSPELPPGIDARFYCGKPDLSELPQAYKNAAAVRAQIDKFGLARVVDTIEPYGCIMAGDREADAPWRKKKVKK
jgi:RNA-splicing ligase RtcB